MRSLFKSTSLFAALVASLVVSGPAFAEDSIQTGDGLLLLRASMPEQARAGEAFSYTVQVTNNSDNVVLHDIKLKQRKAKGLTIESVSLQNSEASDENKSKKDTAEKKTQSKNEMTIASLHPGDSRTFEIKATADDEGELKSCLEITSYTPALCLQSRVVKPELELTKTAPQKADRCNMIEIEYTVKNGGSGDVGPFTVTDSLGEGLTTIEGNSELKFEVDGLQAGDTRKFVGRVYAEKPGEFSSRAVAKAKNSDLESRSKETTTKVIAADLAAKVTGPNRVYGDELARFTAEVTNTGNVDAEDVRVQVMWPTAVRLVDMGDASMTMNSNNKQGKQKESSQQPTPAKKKSADSAKKQSKQQNAKQQKSDADKKAAEMEMAEETIVIDRLKAGQTAKFEYAIRPGDVDELPTKIVATYVCTIDGAEDQKTSTARASSTAMANTKVIRLPAMQLVVIDDEDPVSNGDKVVYRIRVWNEGDAADQDVQLVAKLPKGLEFVSADGPTKSKRDGSTVTFEPIETMEAGDQVDYQVIAKCVGDEGVRFQAKLTSKELQSEVTAEEPTRLFSRQASK